MVGPGAGLVGGQGVGPAADASEAGRGLEVDGTSSAEVRAVDLSQKTILILICTRTEHKIHFANNTMYPSQFSADWYMYTPVQNYVSGNS